MNDQSDSPVPPPEGSLIWERPEPQPKPVPGPLSRRAIVDAAIQIADQEGLESVSLRKVAAELSVGPMRLYGYMSTKEELLDLMADEVYGDTEMPSLDGAAWRTTLEAFARGLRRAAHRHPWFVDLLGARPHIGPKALAHLEATLDALNRTPAFADEIDRSLRALRSVAAYAAGAARREITESGLEAATGLNKAEWQMASSPYIQRMIASGRHPMLARLVRDAAHLNAEAVFEDGLACMLDGIASRLKS